MKASMALVATSTRCPCCPGEVWVIAIDSPRENAADGLLSASTRLAGGLGLKGVLPFRFRPVDGYAPSDFSGAGITPAKHLLRTPGSPVPAELRDSTSSQFYWRDAYPRKQLVECWFRGSWQSGEGHPRPGGCA